MTALSTAAEPAQLDGDGLPTLVRLLHERGYRVIGPVRRAGSIVYGDVRAPRDLALGWTTHQAPGRFRLEEREDGGWFPAGVGPGAPRAILHPPEETLLEAHRRGAGFDFRPVDAEGPPIAFVGIRPCDLAAIQIQDRVLRDGPYPDAGYAARRRNTATVVFNCTEVADTCFCASLGTGPAATAGFDLALTEVLAPDRHVLVADVGTELGRELLADLDAHAAPAADIEAARDGVTRAASAQVRHLDTDGLHDRILDHPEDPRWAQVAKRCLACTNCTLACPTCFCTTVVDEGDLAGTTFRRRQRWASCFDASFTYMHGGPVRRTIRSRYRQWLTHKLATWVDQFGEIGCVGCGRCITWCPVGIDLTEEAAAIGRDDHHADPVAAGARGTHPGSREGGAS